MYPWERRRKPRQKFKVLLKKAKLKLKKYENTSITLGCLKFFQNKNGKYYIQDEYGNILHDGLTESQAAKQITKYSDDAKAAEKTIEDHVYDVAYNIRGLSLKLSSKAKKTLQDLVVTAWDEVSRLPSKKRKGAVCVMEHPKYGIITGISIKGISRGKLPDNLYPILDDWLRVTLKKMDDKIIPRNWQHGKCAEVSVLSELLWKIDPSGKLNINQIRKILNGTISKAADLNKNPALHGNFKPACFSCNPMLKYFNIFQDINKI